MSDYKKIMDMIEQNDVEFVNLTFSDPRGGSYRISYVKDMIEEDVFKSGLNFDGSSVKGWKSINESDMTLMPDASTAYLDPFAAQNTINILCDVYDPRTKKPYARCPRNTARKAEEYLKSLGLGDIAYFGPELEYFIFEDVRYKSDINEIFVHIDSEEGSYNSARVYDSGNSGHRPQVKGGYLSVQPIDSLGDLRSEMLTTMRMTGLSPTLHHHEVASSQCELGFKFSTLVETADNVQKCKYVVHNVADSYGKTATFMPKPIRGDNGSGMHVHQSIWKGGKNLFAGAEYAGLSDIALYYVGGIIKHARALNAFTNPSTNSYKRLVPGFEAPVILAYSAGNRSASIRIPFVASDNAKRIEARFPDPTANPYYAFSALLLAGLDGIKNKIHPGEAIDKNLYELPKDEQKKLPHVCSSLKESLDSLEKDHKFLTEGGVFTEDQISSYIELKLEEVAEIDQTPHPLEFSLYYSS